MTGQVLHVKTRKEPSPGSLNDNWTLFARLSAETLNQLTFGESTVEFLPLKLTGDGLNDPVYISYNGGLIEEQGKVVQVYFLTTQCH